MDNEEKLLGMMAIVEEQQEAIKQLAESTATNNENLQQKLTQQQNHLAKEHREVINQYDGLFKKHLVELTDRGNHWLDWNKLIMSVAVVGVCCVVIVAGFIFYIQYLNDKLIEAEIGIAELKGVSPKITMCPHKEKNYACARIKKEWGSYRVDGESDYYILDSKL